jgi:hypothetical protein
LKIIVFGFPILDGSLELFTGIPKILGFLHESVIFESQEETNDFRVFPKPLSFIGYRS